MKCLFEIFTLFNSFTRSCLSCTAHIFRLSVTQLYALKSATETSKINQTPPPKKNLKMCLSYFLKTFLFFSMICARRRRGRDVSCCHSLISLAYIYFQSPWFVLSRLLQTLFASLAHKQWQKTSGTKEDADVEGIDCDECVWWARDGRRIYSPIHLLDEFLQRVRPWSLFAFFTILWIAQQKTPQRDWFVQAESMYSFTLSVETYGVFAPKDDISFICGYRNLQVILFKKKKREMYH